MNLSQAARTGRKFRRKSDPEVWYRLDGKAILRAHISEYPSPTEIDAEMLVASDWEAEPLAMTLTAQDVMRAAREHDMIASQRRLSAAEFGKLVCESLGLLEEE